MESAKDAPSAERKRTPWETCLDYATGNANGEVAIWKDEMSNLLIFATLFSGVVGSFSIESYHNVQENPADTTVLLLKSILALQLNATSPQPQTNLPLPIDLNPETPITASARRINIYNFLSLILSLSVVMAGILCLQWLREYDQDPCGIPRPRREHLGIRCMRNEGMEKWRVFTVLKTLPLILLLSLFLFFAGIIELLLRVDRTAAIVSSVVIGIAATFMVATTVIPTFLTFCIRWRGRHRFSQCPWKSPQAWVFYQLFGAPIHLITSAISALRGRPLSEDAKDVFKLQDWSVYDWLVYKDSDVANIGFGIHWLGALFLQEKEFAEALYKCIQDSSVHKALRDTLFSKNDTRRVESFHREWAIVPNKGIDADQVRASHLADVTVFQTLAHLAEKVERGHPPTVLLQQRLDLFFKINGLHHDKDIDCPLVGDVDQKVLDPPEMRQRLSRCISDLMRDDNGINESHLVAMNDIFDFEANAQNSRIELFDEALTALNDWITRKEDEQDEGGDKLSPEPQGNASLLENARRLRNHVRYLRGLVVNRGL